MRKLVYMSLWLGPVIIAIRAAAGGNAKRGLRLTVVSTFTLTVIWVLLAPYME